MTTKRAKDKILSHYGLTDYYKYYLKNTKSKNPIDNKKYMSVIDDFNLGVIDMILHEEIQSYTIPKVGCTLKVGKRKNTPIIKDGVLVNRLPVDYKSTKELWETNEEAKEKRILVRFTNNHTNKYIYRIKFAKDGEAYKNKKYYSFVPSRSFKRALAKRIFDNDLDSFHANDEF